jgi:hypothetical protein
LGDGDTLETAARLLVPDEVSWGYGWGSLDGTRINGFDEEIYTVGVTWYISPREVRVLDDLTTPRTWTEPEREPAKPLVTVDEDGNTTFTVPQAVYGGASGGALGLAWYLFRRRVAIPGIKTG